MQLARLEISGFKSFAKSVSLSFPVAISAIVGPNGSGKSNVAEAIRWVLGEQSMKSLRGKRGEDLIFNGSPSLPRIGKASVVLAFDNADGKIPVDFPEVRIERRIFRDGTNEYLMNGSAVRLKDIVELMARIGLGDTKHNIIGQGEVDRWLLSSSNDRREILEEALGLKVYEMRKAESERKLAATEENLKDVESLLRELAPHLKFLKHQADKAAAREAVERDLSHLERVYFAKRLLEIEAEEGSIREHSAPREEELGKIEKRISQIKKEIFEKENEPGPVSSEDRDGELDSLEEERQSLEREYGRLEGKISVLREKMKTPLIRLPDASYVKEKLGSVEHIFERKPASLDEALSSIESALNAIKLLRADLERGSVEVSHDDASRKELSDFENEAKILDEGLRGIHARLAEKRMARKKLEEEGRLREIELRKLERELRETEGRRSIFVSELERSGFLKENLKTRRDEIEKEMALAAVEEDSLRAIDKDELERHPAAQDLFRKIERLRGKLEEIGGIDFSVVKEFEETESRYAFLTNELADIKAAGVSLRELIGTLEKQIAEDFEKGFKKVNEGFDRYFKIIFGGGSAKLLYQDTGKRDADDGISPEVPDTEPEYGIDIDVDIPRKRIKSLAMLSGGERALTSIALLFAMVSVNPPPFLVLDETDAALDEANSQKYANTLAELSRKTQLIIITHNRETMSRADVLYGVTMGGDGVSKLLSIKLEEGEKYANR